jgi:hypothetical protein
MSVRPGTHDAPAAAAPARWGGVALASVLPALRRAEPEARACWLYDGDAFDARAREMREAFAPIGAIVAQALKANALPELLARGRAAGLAAECGSLGELRVAETGRDADQYCATPHPNGCRDQYGSPDEYAGHCRSLSHSLPDPRSCDRDGCCGFHPAC